MENKYYTPTIEEFHVGFEYEMKIGFGDGTVKTEREFNDSLWNNEVTKIGDIPYINRSLTGKNSNNGICGIRVKYLDEKDIVELGWFKVKPLEDTINYYSKCGNYELEYFHNKYYIYFIDEELNQIFVGFIKNKSEIKKLMQQLNIK